MKQPDSKNKMWAAVRLPLGLGQMAGAVVAFALLLQTGMNGASLAAVVGTCLLTTVSVMLFGRRRG